MADVVFHDGGLGFAGVSLYFEALSPAAKKVFGDIFGNAAVAVEIRKSIAPLFFDRLEKAGLRIKDQDLVGNLEDWKARWEN